MSAARAVCIYDVDMRSIILILYLGINRRIDRYKYNILLYFNNITSYSITVRSDCARLKIITYPLKTRLLVTGELLQTKDVAITAVEVLSAHSPEVVSVKMKINELQLVKNMYNHSTHNNII